MRSPKLKRGANQIRETAPDNDHDTYGQPLAPRISPGLPDPIFHEAIVTQCLIELGQPIPSADSASPLSFDVEIGHDRLRPACSLEHRENMHAAQGQSAPKRSMPDKSGAPVLQTTAGLPSPRMRRKLSRGVWRFQIRLDEAAAARTTHLNVFNLQRLSAAPASKKIAFALLTAREQQR